MNRIATLRKERGLSQKELGAIIGAAQNTISNWENGNREPDYENLKKLAFYFDCSVDYLLGNTSFGKSFVFDETSKKDVDWSGRPLSDSSVRSHSLINNDPELTSYLKELRTRPEMRMLFSVAKGATKEDVEKAVAIIEALRKTEGK